MFSGSREMMLWNEWVNTYKELFQMIFLEETKIVSRRHNAGWKPCNAILGS